jgi:putative oxidoreductase
MTADTIQAAALGSRRQTAAASRGIFQSLVGTANDVGPTILRLMLALVIFPHGAQKALGWFGGYGIGGTLGFFGSMGIPVVFGLLAIAAEFLGAIGLAVGLLSRVAAFGIASTMVVAILTVHAQNGFFMNWAGTAKGEGFEYHLLVLAMTLVIMVKGGGKASLDRALTHRAEG